MERFATLSDMKNLFVIFFLAVFFGACSERDVQDREAAGKCAVEFMEKFFSFKFPEAELLCTSDTRDWVVWYVSNITETDIDSIHRIPNSPKVELQSVVPDSTDTTAVAYCKARDFYCLDSLGQHGRMIDEAVFRLSLVRECGEWRVRMEGPLQSER